MASKRFFVGDTAIFEASIFEDDGVTPSEPISSTWQITDPDGVHLVLPDAPADPAEGDIVILNQNQTVGGDPYLAWDVLTWNGSVWSKVAEAVNDLDGNDATFRLPAVVVTKSGLYQGRVKFTMDNDDVRSEIEKIEVIDPFNDIGITDRDNVIDGAWMKIEDAFDSELGGPHLRDRTLAIFDKQKMAALLPDAIYKINATYQPATSYTDENFPYLPHGPLLSQALLVQTIKHLIRSYTEQPLAVGGANISYFDRRDYQQRWQAVLEIEERQLMEWLDLFKRDLMGFGTGALLIGGYQSAYAHAPRWMRARYPRIVPYW